MKKTQSGFTLVEIAIVLVIIGLLLGGVLKGQAMIESAKVKNLGNDLKGIETAFYAYQDKFRALPGDDITAATHVTGATNATTGGTVGNGRIEGVWNSTTATNESALFWQHIRLAGLATGNSTAGTLGTNAAGGTMGISSTSPLSGYTAGSGGVIGGSHYVCSSGIDGKLVRQLDIMIDDGSALKGSLVAATDAAPTTALTAEPVDGTAYTVCLAF
ncbi:prepilin-type N-terminal cleavage/methylation domain-containing protein [Sulfuricella sp.]|uniref:prepilin-type N-terminal cleavage/methylation domain-containing protein n=1 Tax=Sulfuricella sp. TaxID=2099377 RepID=UPI002CF6D3C7|nr:prepilin-type N-terminal cleavage/methylation domain-containing protein [Sulfuricella sp.]HUX63421.1 prepilin-type N-terminal cleavage/methylation domain-containing protein [Sulfuricella sp.]